MRLVFLGLRAPVTVVVTGAGGADDDELAVAAADDELAVAVAAAFATEPFIFGAALPVTGIAFEATA